MMGPGTMMPGMNPTVPQMMPGAAMPGMMTPQQMAQMNPQQLAQMQMMMQAQMQMMMQAMGNMGGMMQPHSMPQQMPGNQMGQMAAGPGVPEQSNAASPGGAQFNDLVTAFQQKNSISGAAGAPAQGPAQQAAAPGPAQPTPGGGSGNPFDMFG